MLLCLLNICKHYWFQPDLSLEDKVSWLQCDRVTVGYVWSHWNGCVCTFQLVEGAWDLDEWVFQLIHLLYLLHVNSLSLDSIDVCHKSSVCVSSEMNGMTFQFNKFFSPVKESAMQFPCSVCCSQLLTKKHLLWLFHFDKLSVCFVS